MSDRSEVWFGDVVDAWVALEARGDDERAVVAEMLGFERRSVSSPTVSPNTAPIHPADTTEKPEADRPSRDRPSTRSRKATRDVPLTALTLQHPAGTVPAPQWQVAAVALEPERPTHVGFEPPPESLFEFRWTRAILAALCAVTSDGVELDVEALVERLARGLAVLELPRRQLPTLRLGVQLLVDESESMMSFSRDVEEIVARISEVVGRDRTQTLRFAGSPLRGAGPGSLSTWRKPYPVPSAGTPVVLLSDLGLTRGALRRDGARVREWLRFAARLRAVGCAAIVLAPVPPERWPAALVHAMQILAWDRTTTAGRAHRLAAGEGSR
jgi:hypothetical protein